MIAPNVKVIAPTVKAEKNDYNIIRSSAIKRVCAYCRVSTDSEEQETSYKSQVAYYTKMISEHEGWIFAGIYADEGITGTSMRKRKEFLRMIDDAMDGKIDMILCKSVSRFARNTVDCLSILEKLKEKNIPVMFEMEKINSLDDERATRLRITLESASAQEYSENLSHSVAWGKRQRIEQGYYTLHHAYGYDIIKANDKTVNAQYVINEQEASVIRFICDSYLNGYTTNQISKLLAQKGIKSPTGRDKWYESTILRMMSNELYVGDLLYQKTIGTDIKSRRRVVNTTQKRYLIENHHPAIISRAMFERLAKETEYRNSLRGYSNTGRSVYTSLYPFSNKLYCMECGSKLRRHYYGTKEGIVHTWVCINHKLHGDECHQKQVKEDSLKGAFVRALSKLIDNKDELLATVKQNIQSVIDQRVSENSIAKLDPELNNLQRQVWKLVEESVSDRTGQVMAESQKVMAKMAEIKAEKEQRLQEQERFGFTNMKMIDLEKFLSKKQIFEEFDDNVFRKLVERVNIRDNEAIFIFNDMVKVNEQIEL